MKITTNEIFKLAKETTEKELDTLIASFKEDEKKTFDFLFETGDPKGLAVWTVIAKRYENKDHSMYEMAYYS